MKKIRKTFEEKDLPIHPTKGLKLGLKIITSSPFFLSLVPIYQVLDLNGEVKLDDDINIKNSLGDLYDVVLYRYHPSVWTVYQRSHVCVH